MLCTTHPTGIHVMLSFYGLHHNPTVWPNPEVKMGDGTRSGEDISGPTLPPTLTPGHLVSS